MQAWINRTAGGPFKGMSPTPGPKRSLAVMPRPEGLQVGLMGCNRRPRADLFSQLAQAAQVASRVRVGFGKPVLHAVQQAIELFAESEGFFVMDEPWGAFPGSQRASYGFSDGGRIAGGQ